VNRFRHTDEAAMLAKPVRSAAVVVIPVLFHLERRVIAPRRPIRRLV
jgi:hypothetical protein